MSQEASRLFERSFSSLEEFADFISEKLQAPVTIEDSNHRLLAYSTHEEHTDSARVSTIIGRRVPEQVINKLWREGIIPSLHKQNTSVKIPEIAEIGLGSRMAVAIKKKQEILGYIWVLEGERALREDDAAVLEVASEKAATQLQQVQTRNKEEERGRQEYFWRLLTGDVQKEEDIERQMREWFPVSPRTAAVIVLEAEEPISESMYKKITYLVTTSQKVKCYFQTRVQQLIVMLAEPVYPPDREGIRWFLEDFIVLLKERFQIEQMEAGTGRLYSSLASIKNSYEEAMEVIHVNKKLPAERKPFVFYHELGFYRYAEALIEQKNKQNMLHPELEALKQYDFRHNTELFQSLAVFLRHDGNMKKASESLHIHVNTMAYRIKRVEEIIKKDLKDAYEKLSLLLEISLDEMNK
ncbi:PucR family transcriptional regulator [Salibacterium aidingense]|uniref:PucR family transcriptional regulator n=1 Tax=Salibacterium aidingense TaxID=384933 RepID=UPI0004012EC2|nr:helix-turn-helix domain-containing protein [Salibacterium aidingense]